MTDNQAKVVDCDIVNMLRLNRKNKGNINKKTIYLR